MIAELNMRGGNKQVKIWWDWGWIESCMEWSLGYTCIILLLPLSAQQDPWVPVGIVLLISADEYK